MCDQQSLRSACAYAQPDKSLCLSLKYSMIVKLLTEYYLEFLSLKEGCIGSSKSTLVKMPHCWKSHVTAQIFALRPHADIFVSFATLVGWQVNKVNSLACPLSILHCRRKGCAYTLNNTGSGVVQW